MSFKEVYDEVHGYVRLTPLALRFCDTQEFQRLGYIKQLGASSLVFPCADHTRKAHSFGCYHLSQKIVLNLKSNHPREVTGRDLEIIPLAGLLHDIGHGPYSHVFDRYLCDVGIENMSHEERGARIIRKMVSKYSIPISPEEVEDIILMIHPGQKGGWRHQVVSGVVDADRMDYIVRDSRNVGIVTSFGTHNVNRIISHTVIKNGNLTFSQKVQRDIESLLRARQSLHEVVYQHKVSVALEQMLIDFMCLSDPHRLWIRGVIEDEGLTEFCSLTDADIVRCAGRYDIPEEAKKILERIWKRDLYKVVSQVDYEEEIEEIEETQPGVTYVKRWVGMDTDDVHPMKRINFSGEISIEAGAYRKWRVSKIYKKSPN